MRLLHVETLKLTGFSAHETPPYVILSHCWRHGINEILYEDVKFSKPEAWRRTKRQAAKKVLNACVVASDLGFEYIWIDTCCIDKRSSSEQSEAINSMFLWYQQAAVCIAFLDDIRGLGDLGSSRWFTRGWTLQELIAPSNLQFYNKDWLFIDDRFAIAKELSAITLIDEVVLRHGHHPEPVAWVDHKPITSDDGSPCACGFSCPGSNKLRWVLDTFSFAMIMSWAAHRRTSREEDTAYCLMGLFDINMPLLYGEKGKACTRLQDEIIRRTHDQSIIAWLTAEAGKRQDLPNSPTYSSPFHIKKPWSLEHGIVHKVPKPSRNVPKPSRNIPKSPMSITGQGLEMDLLLFPMERVIDMAAPDGEEQYLAVLNCTVGDNPLARPAIFIGRSHGSDNIFVQTMPKVIAILSPDSSLLPDGYVSKGIVQGLVDPLNILGNWKTRIDLNTGEVRRITLSHKPLSGGPQPNQFRLPPLRIGKIVDCSLGKYTVECALPEFNQTSNLTPPCNERYGLISLTKDGLCRFLVAWGFRDKRGWCKVLPDDERLTWTSYASVEEKHKQLLPEVRHQGHTGKSKRVLDFGGFSRKVEAELKLSGFLGTEFLELSIAVGLAPKRNSIRG
ncbi:heterokaryon incompatibility protein-domain-containing protein [Nemania diffusa]|nr:heterokaryon incompatibility protein-domain-containing protein [Nemania diffusa]